MMRRVAVVALSMAVGAALAAPGAQATFPAASGELMHPWSDISGKAMWTSSGVAATDLRTGASRNVISCVWQTAPDDCATGEGAASADGERVAVAVSDSAGPFPQATHRLALLTPDGAENGSVPLAKAAFDPAWSPDGSSLLVTRYDGTEPFHRVGTPQVIHVSVAGSELGAVTPPGGADADWSATGEIAYAYDGDVWVRRLDAAPRRLTTTGGAAPSWAPDGQRIAFEREGRIWTMLADGGGQRELSDIEAYAPAWSPDGRYLAVLRRAFDDNESPGRRGVPYAGDVWVMGANGGCPRAVRRSFAYSFYGRPFWRPVRDAMRDLPEPCSHLRSDLRDAKARVRATSVGFRYRFRAAPRAKGVAAFRTTRKVAIPGAGVARRVKVARVRFTAGPKGVVRLRARLTRQARRALHAKGALRVTAVVTVRDATGGVVTRRTAKKGLTLLAPRRH
jgi:Tol biopolymer transport system component